MKDEISIDSELWNKSLIFNSKNSYILESASGKGKSSFVSFCYGLRDDYCGKILIDEIDCEKINANYWSKIRKNKLSIVPQDLKLFNNISVLDNLLIKNNLTNNKTQDEIIELMQILQIDSYKNKIVSKLSLGQQQRVAILRALLQDFEFIILDEPFSHLDKQNTILAMNIIIKECERQNANFIITSLGNDISLSKNTIKIIL
jgi:putative ABC transport system ATP-binding protein